LTPACDSSEADIVEVAVEKTTIARDGTPLTLCQKAGLEVQSSVILNEDGEIYS
jgi:hypothetical protein